MSLWSNTDSAASKPKYLGLGQLQSITLAGTMTGYTSGSFTIGAPPAGGVQATATYTAVGGIVTSYVITNQGSGYTSAPSVTAAGGTGGTFTGVIKPIDKVTGPATNIIFVDTAEAQLEQNRARGIKIPGWTKYMEYVDNSGANRYKVECLIPISATSVAAGDGLDDVIASDAAFAIQTQPLPASVTAPAATSFTVAATGATGYQWQVRLAAGGSYTNITNGGVYTTATTATLNISNSTGLNGNRYRCQVVNTTAGAAVTSTGALLTVA
jgi:hypothetical protein